MKIEIKSIWESLLFEYDCEENSIKKTLIESLKNGANLFGANLRGANLFGANLRGVDLRGANLFGANLFGANLFGANLRGANLFGANLFGADLRDADLRDSDLRGADLFGANLFGANLRGADLRDADLRDSDLRGADLFGANLNEKTAFVNICCPEEGSFIGFKKANDKIVKLFICEDAKRSSATSLKCRCSKAKVLQIQNIDGTDSGLTEISSNYDSKFIYRVGEIIEVEDFEDNRWIECAAGIHFFTSREQAVKY